MIRKPPVQVERESVAVQTLQDLRSAASTGATIARAGSYYARGVFLWCVALLWGLPAIVAGLFGQLPTLIGVGTLAAFMGWMGMRMFAKARECRHVSTSMTR